MRQYKLIALDMDGTLLNEDGEVSAVNRRSILAAQEAGIIITLATGRGMHRIKPIARELQLTDPVVSVNGGVLWKNTDERWKEHTLDQSLIKRMRDLADRYDSWYWAYSESGPCHKDAFIDDLSSTRWYKFGYQIEDDQSRQAILETLQSWGLFEISNSHPHNIEVNPRGIHKASGLIEVCKLKGLNMQEVIAVGDSLNDLHMIRAAGLGVAMGNAQEEVKQAADVVTVSNQENGVAKVIEEYLL